MQISQALKRSEEKKTVCNVTPKLNGIQSALTFQARYLHTFNYQCLCRW